MTKYQLKDKARQAQLDVLSDVNKFSDRLQVACKREMRDDGDHIFVEFGKDRSWFLHKNKVITDYEFSFRILKSEIEVIEDLKPYVWHSREKWDGNPNNYSVIQFHNDEPDLFIGIPTKSLGNSSTHFMYIERPEVSNG